jgi:hypothetical protein
MMFYLQKILLVILLKSLIISCINLNLRLSKNENRIYEDVEIKKTNKGLENYFFLDKKYQSQGTLVINYLN